MDPIAICIGSVIAMVALLFIGTPIALALGMVGILSLTLMEGFEQAASFLTYYPFSVTFSWTLAIIPLFILMAQFAWVSGIGDEAYDTAYKWTSGFRGGLAITTIMASAGFAATVGSTIATATVMGKLGIPEMRKRGYDKRLAAGSVSAGGLLGILIPPSIAAVIYCSVTDVSIPRVLLAGYLPGIMTALLFASATWYLAKFRNMAPAGKSFSWKERLIALKGGSKILIVAAFIFGGLYSGVFTATEVAAVGCCLVFLMSIPSLKGHWADVKLGLWETARLTAMILAIYIGARLFLLPFTLSGLSDAIAQNISNLPLHPLLIVGIILLIYVPLGMFLDSISMYLITLPFLFPIVESLGFSGVWFGILMIKMCELGQLTPPLGMICFVVKGICPPDISLGDVFKGAVPFMLVECVAILILFFFPQISLLIPNLAFGSQ